MSNAVSDRELDKKSLDDLGIGYRRTLGKGKGIFNLNEFHYSYDDVFARISLSATPELSTPCPYLNVQGAYDNLLEGDATGFEAFLDWDFNDSLGMSLPSSHLSYSFQSLIDFSDPFVRSSIQFSINEFDQSTPNNMATLNLRAKFSDDWDLDTGLLYSQSCDFAKGLQPRPSPLNRTTPPGRSNDQTKKSALWLIASIKCWKVLKSVARHCSRRTL